MGSQCPIKMEETWAELEDLSPKVVCVLQAQWGKENETHFPSTKPCVLKGIRAAPRSTLDLMQTIQLRYVWSCAQSKADSCWSEPSYFC